MHFTDLLASWQWAEWNSVEPFNFLIGPLITDLLRMPEMPDIGSDGMGMSSMPMEGSMGMSMEGSMGMGMPMEQMEGQSESEAELEIREMEEDAEEQQDR